MQPVHLSSLDLNQLLVLHTLLEARSVTAAARKLGLSQSATSHALARLRRSLGDPLLVRGARGLVPSARAQQMRAPLAEALGRLEQVIAPPEAFDPARAERRFVVAAADYSELLLAAPLLHAVRERAPGVDLWFQSAGGDATQRLTAGDLDLAIGPMNRDLERAGIQVRKLFEERFVCVVRRGHPALRRPWTPASFAAMEHAFIAPRGRPGGAVDDALARLGLSRRVVFATGHFLVAPYVVARSDLVLTLVERVALILAEAHGLAVVEPPVRLPRFPMCMFWHERSQHEAAHAWLREQVAEAAAALG